MIRPNLLHAPTGPLTRELLLSPGGFGLGHVPDKSAPDAVTTMVCGYCSTGCGLRIHLRDGQAVNLSPDTEYPVNLGMACPKGWEALTVLDSPDRATTPLLRGANGKLEPVDWPTALDAFRTRFKTVQSQYGSASVAFLSTGQMATEEMAFLGALAKFGMGMLHGDGNTRQCMATSVVAYKQAFGFDAPPYTYADLEESDTLIFVGSNLCLAHPILWERVMRNPHKPEIIVLDPRMTETAMNATLHLPLYPKSDLVLLYGVAKLLLDASAVDHEFIRAHTTGFEEFATFVQEYTLERVASETQLPPEAILRFAELIQRGQRVSFWWTMGVNQSHQGVRTAQAIINLALMTGNIGRPGTGPNSITGQCNAMGSRIFSNTTNLLGGRDFANAEHRAKVANTLGIEESCIPRETSRAYPEIMEDILRGKIRGLWVVCTNPAHSWINQGFAHDVLDRLDFLVVQDMYANTETARHAHLVLPAAGWGEKSGTFINSERRFGLMKPVSRAPGQALSDFRIFRLIAEAWGCGEMFRDWTSPEAVFEILKKLSVEQPCDISGIKDYAMLDSHGGIQWPWPSSSHVPPDEQCSHHAPRDEPHTEDVAHEKTRHPERDNYVTTERRLFEDGRFFTPDGRAQFLFETPRAMKELPSERYPFLLNTGRGSASQWHTQTRTRNSAVLRKLYPEAPFLEINPADARTLGIEQNTWVEVSSPRGRLRAKAFVTPAVQPGQVFMPMHYETTNLLTDSSFDPYSRQPAYKGCAVDVRRAGA